MAKLSKHRVVPIRRLAARTKHAVLSRRVVAVGAGPGYGLRIGLNQASADYRSGRNEWPVQQAMADHLSLGQVAYDIGSNVGFFALVAARLVGPKGSVHAFEAVPACSRALERNRKRNKLDQITVHAVAVGRQSGLIELFQSVHPGGATISERDRPPDYRATLSVPCVSIDDLVASGELPPPDLVKIDVEGAEAPVLAGMAATLANHRPVIVCELDDSTETGVETKRGEVMSLLEPLGYEVSQLDASYPDSRSLVIHLLARQPVAPPSAPQHQSS